MQWRSSNQTFITKQCIEHNGVKHANRTVLTALLKIQTPLMKFEPYPMIWGDAPEHGITRPTSRGEGQRYENPKDVIDGFGKNQTHTHTRQMNTWNQTHESWVMRLQLQLYLAWLQSRYRLLSLVYTLVHFPYGSCNSQYSLETKPLGQSIVKYSLAYRNIHKLVSYNYGKEVCWSQTTSKIAPKHRALESYQRHRHF